jgi:ethanolamine ammonia-lyase large subunit
MKHPYLQKIRLPCESKKSSLSEQGYIALVSVIIISALIILIASSANLIGISESSMGLKEEQSWEAFYLANACGEEALMKLKESLKYKGDETLIFENGTCTILSGTGAGNQNRMIKVSASAYNIVRKIKIVGSNRFLKN